MDNKFENILVGTLKLFKKYGLRCISMDVIACHLGISKKTLYQFVENKDDLIAKSYEYIIEKDSSADIVNNQNLNAIEALLEISRNLREAVSEMNPAVVYDLNKYYPAVYKNLITKKIENVYSDMLINLHKGIKEEMYREDIDKDLISKIYIKQLMEIHDSDYFKETSEQVFQVMFDNQIRSIVTKKGLEYYEQRIKPQSI
jgi:AcrR family transcriptional regulator